MTKPCTTKPTATGAKCANSCAGVCNTAEIGSRPGSLESAKPAAQLMRRRSEQTAPSSGPQATEARPVTGVEQNCEPIDAIALRWILAALVIGWASAVIVGIRGCAA